MPILRNSVPATLVAALLFLAPSFSWGQQKASGGGGGGNSNAAGFQFGQVWPAGAIGHNADGSIAPGIFYEYAASPIFSVQVNLIRSSHNDILTLFSTTAGIRANLTYYDRLVPYATAGVGLYSVHRKLDNPTVGGPMLEVNTTNFGLNFGLGADLDLSESFFMGLWVGLHNLFGAKTSTSAGTTEENSGRWSALFIRAGMRF